MRARGAAAWQILPARRRSAAACIPAAQERRFYFARQGPLEQSNFIRFEELDEDSIYNSAIGLSGSGGRSGLNADGLKRMLCSKSFKVHSKIRVMKLLG